MVKQLTLLFSFFLTTIAFSQGNNPYFSITPAKFNADDAEIGVYKNAGNNALILVSSKEWGIVKRVNGNDQHFFNYFTVDAKSNKVSKFQRKSNSKFNEGPLCFTPDGKRVFFTRNSKKKNDSLRQYNCCHFYKCIVILYTYFHIFFNKRNYKSSITNFLN